MVGEWVETTLGDVIELKRGYDLPQQERMRGSVPLVSSSGITDYHSTAKVKGPGVVTGRYGTLGRVFYVREDFWPLNTTLYVRDFKGNDPRFLSYFLTGLDYLAYSDKAAVPGLNRNHLHEATVHFPSNVDEQCAIAHILGTLDDKIELNCRMSETLEAMARALFKSWFVDFDPVRAKIEGRWKHGQSLSGLPAHLYDFFPHRLVPSELGEIPEGWEVRPFSTTVEVIGGGTPKTSVDEYWGGDIPWFSVVDAPTIADIWVVDTEKKVTQKGVEASSTRLLPVGTTIISARGTVGRLALVGVPMAMNQSCYGLRGKQGADGFFNYFSTRMLVSDLQRRAHGSVFDTITRDTLASVAVIVPPERVVEKFERLASPLLNGIRKKLLQARTLAALRGALLPKLISGALRVTDTKRFIGKAV